MARSQMHHVRRPYDGQPGDVLQLKSHAYAVTLYMAFDMLELKTLYTSTVDFGVDDVVHLSLQRGLVRT